MGVKTNTSSGAMSVLMDRTISSTSSLSFWASSSCRTQERRSSSLSLPLKPALYFQWAAMPYSAVWCISQVRIWISKGMPSLSSTVVCNDWYMLFLGVEI